MNALVDAIGHLPPHLTYAAVGAVVLAESILLVGVFAPTLTLLLALGALAHTGQASLILVIAVAATAATVGDFLAHRTGRFLSHRLHTNRLGRRIPAAAWSRAEMLMTRHGGRAVFLARFLPVVRTLAPHLAGATHLPYHRIAPYSLTAATLWATAEAGAGYVAATSLQHMLTLGGSAIALAAPAALGVALLWRHLLRRARPTDTPARSDSSHLDGDPLPAPLVTR
ncbi:DedA family protein [Streptomyces stackebrandtii]|uniref:DedA family protein n=1 Tax=Streptomyces stackebrandtii TaxID=3051177 RepID=UPI0028DD27B0|nr:DedA family protein [Streptomyces sp. DSM 40976]